MILIKDKGIEYAISHGVTVVAAAGNDNVDISKKFFSPACINGVVTVARGSRQ